jgi:hypothetical protein
LEAGENIAFHLLFLRILREVLDKGRLVKKGNNVFKTTQLNFN